LAQSVPHTEHQEEAVWHWWTVLILVVVLLTGEWVGRKWAGLP
jgi:Ni,Fe-hydrogenase I cytochrome b subunit